MHSLFQVNMDMVKIVVEKTSCNSCTEKRNHEGKNILFVSCTFQQNDLKMRRKRIEKEVSSIAFY